MLSAEEIRTGVSIATLGSITIAIASFFQKAEFIINYQKSFPDPFGGYLFSGICLLVSSGIYLWYCYLDKDPEYKWLFQLFEISFGCGLFAFFLSNIDTLLIFLRI